MAEAFICDAARTAIGRYAGALAAVRADDLGAEPSTTSSSAPQSSPEVGS